MAAIAAPPLSPYPARDAQMRRPVVTFSSTTPTPPGWARGNAVG